MNILKDIELYGLRYFQTYGTSVGRPCQNRPYAPQSPSPVNPTLRLSSHSFLSQSFPRP